MEDKEIFSKIEGILKSYDYIPSAKKLAPTDRFREDLGMDSLDTYTFGYELEEQFGIDIPEIETNQFEKIEDYVPYIKNKLKSIN